MSDLKSIANKHLDSAAKLQENALKYIIAFGLLILFCWLFAERVYQNTRYDAIRLNRFEQKADSVGLRLSQDFNEKQSESRNASTHRNALLNDRATLNRRIDQLDSTYQNEYKAVEDNLPSALKFILRQATHRPYGILLTAFTTFGFLWYLFDLRKRYWRKLTLGLRILKEEDNGYNKIYDYNIVIPFWAFPLWKQESRKISSKDIVKLAGLVKKGNTYTLVACFMLLVLFIIQVRLFTISLITNAYRLHWILAIQAVLLFLTIALIMLWLLPAPFNNLYNKEEPKETDDIKAKEELDAERKTRKKLSRRNAIVLAGTLVAGGVVGYIARPVGERIAASMLQPRVRKKKERAKDKSVRLVEMEAVKLMQTGRQAAAAGMLCSVLGDLKNRSKLEDFTRLFDLLYLLCQKDRAIYTANFATLKGIAKNSRSKVLVARAKCWEEAGDKKLKRIKRRVDWDKKELLGGMSYETKKEQRKTIAQG